MRRFTSAAVFILFVFAAFDAQAKCSAEQKQRAESIVRKLEADSSLRFAVENNGTFGDCVHYAWMDEMQRLGVKRAAATLDFVWNDKIEKVEIREMFFLSDYDRYDMKLKDKQILEQIETSGLKKRLEEAILERAREHLLILIESLKRDYANRLLTKEPKGKITGTLYHVLLDDESLPVLVAMPDVEF